MRHIEPRQLLMFGGLLALIAMLLNYSLTSTKEAAREPAGSQSPAVLGDQGKPSAEAKAAREAAEAKRKYRERYLNPVPLQGNANIAVVAADANGGLYPSLAGLVIRRLRLEAAAPTTGLFTSTFVADGLFDELYQGSAKPITDLDLQGRLSRVIVAREHLEFTKNPELENLVSAHMRIEVRVWNLPEYRASQSWGFDANGAGFTEVEARTMAGERIMDKMKEDPKFQLEPL